MSRARENELSARGPHKSKSRSPKGMAQMPNTHRSPPPTCNGLAWVAALRARAAAFFVYHEGQRGRPRPARALTCAPGSPAAVFMSDTETLVSFSCPKVSRPDWLPVRGALVCFAKVSARYAPMSGRPKTSVTGVAGWVPTRLDRRCRAVCFPVECRGGFGRGDGQGVI